MKQSPIASAIQVDLDKPRTLLLDFNAFVAYRDQTGTELPNDIAALFVRNEKGEPALDGDGNPLQPRPLTTRQLRAIVWAGLVHEDEELTIKQVGRLMTTRNLGLLTEAIHRSIEGLEEEPADPTPAEATESQSDGIGTKSEPSAKSTLGLVKKKSSGG